MAAKTSNGRTSNGHAPDAEVEIEGDRRIVRVAGWTLWAPLDRDEPSIDDLELAPRLGYARARDLRKLTKRLLVEGKLRDVSMRSTVERIEKRGAFAGRVEERTVNVYVYNEAQTIKLIAKSETKIADALLDEVIATFIAARRGLLVPIASHELQSQIVELQALVASYEARDSGTIGTDRARTYVLDLLNEAARIRCFALKDPSNKRFRSVRKDLENQVRMHVHYPACGAQSMAMLPTNRLGDAHGKAQEILRREKREAGYVERKVQQGDLFRDYAPRNRSTFSMEGDE